MCHTVTSKNKPFKLQQYIDNVTKLWRCEINIDIQILSEVVSLYPEDAI